MNKQEILAKNKKDGLDEREQTVYSRSFGFGAVVVAVLCLAFSVYRAFHGEKFFEATGLTNVRPGGYNDGESVGEATTGIRNHPKTAAAQLWRHNQLVNRPRRQQGAA